MKRDDAGYAEGWAGCLFAVDKLINRLRRELRRRSPPRLRPETAF